MAGPPGVRRALAACLVLVASCAERIPDGTERAVREEWPSGVVRVEGTEVRRGSKWIKHGDFVFYDEDGDITHQGAFEDGLESGVWSVVYDDGGKSRGEFRAGKREGRWHYSYANGRPAQEGEYRAGERVGTWKHWSPAGEVRSDLVYDASPD